MKALLLYGSTNGRTRKTVNTAVQRLALKPDVVNVKEPPSTEQISAYDLLLIFCPTYGDEELQTDMEDFIKDFSLDLTGKRFVICELGNYYGYEDFSLGAMPILRRRLLGLGAQELCSPLSLDSFPRLEESHLHRWIDYVNGHLQS